MITNDRFERDLEAWLEAEAPMTAPVDLHDDVVERARRLRQRPTWLIAVRGGAWGESVKPLVRPRTRVAYLLLVLGLILAALIAAIAVGAFRSDPFKPISRNGAIAFAVGENDGVHPYVAHLIHADGSGDHAIGEGRCPTFFMDGNALAYQSGNRDTAEFKIASADGSAARAVPEIGGSEYALSPDGARIAWFRTVQTATNPARNGGRWDSELWVTAVSGGAGIRIVPQPEDPVAYNVSPVWSPDGHHIAFAQTIAVVSGDNSGSYRSAIYVVDQDGSHLQRLTDRPGTDEIGISWSPDGRHIAYTGLPDGSPLPSLGASSQPIASFYPPQDVFMIGADGAGDRNLTNSTADDIQPEWSPDGQHLAYQTFAGVSGYRLATVRMDRSGVAVGPPTLGPVAQSFAWAPDSTTMLLLQGLASDPSVGISSYSSLIQSVDEEFRQPPTTLLSVVGTIPCAPSWQRIEP